MVFHDKTRPSSIVIVYVKTKTNRYWLYTDNFFIHPYFPHENLDHYSKLQIRFSRNHHELPNSHLYTQLNFLFTLFHEKKVLSCTLVKTTLFNYLDQYDQYDRLSTQFIEGKGIQNGQKQCLFTALNSSKRIAAIDYEVHFNTKIRY